jgi:hypothetical protein
MPLNNLLISCVSASPSLTLLPFWCQGLCWRSWMSVPMFGAQTGNNSAYRRLLPGQEGFQAGHRIHMQMEAKSLVQCLGSAESNRIEP